MVYWSLDAVFVSDLAITCGGSLERVWTDSISPFHVVGGWSESDGVPAPPCQLLLVSPMDDMCWPARVERACPITKGRSCPPEGMKEDTYIGFNY